MYLMFDIKKNKMEYNYLFKICIVNAKFLQEL